MDAGAILSLTTFALVFVHYNTLLRVVQLPSMADAVKVSYESREPTAWDPLALTLSDWLNWRRRIAHAAGEAKPGGFVRSTVDHALEAHVRGKTGIRFQKHARKRSRGQLPSPFTVGDRSHVLTSQREARTSLPVQKLSFTAHQLLYHY